MTPTFNDKLIAYLTLISGLAISAVAEYYSIMGLIAIYPSVFWPIVIMGVVLGLGKITGTVWIKQNWDLAPWFLKTYILPGIVVLMAITSLGVFGYLSKAHSDQNLVSGDVLAKIAVYDEKIKVSKDNIDANRKALKQMDEAVDQVMGRSQDEKGADKAVAIRRGQAKERTRLLSEITAEQKTITQLSEERAPIAAEVRKVEAEVGPIKYIAHLFYGENPDANVLEKAVILVTILIVAVLDPLAVILLLASQYSFQSFRKKNEPVKATNQEYPMPTERRKWENAVFPEVTIAEPKDEEGDSPTGPVADVVSPETTVTTLEVTSEEEEAFKALEPKPIPEKSILEQHPYLSKPFVHFGDMKPLVHRVEEPVVDNAPLIEPMHSEDDAKVVHAEFIPEDEPEDNNFIHAYDDERLVTPHDKKILAAGVDVLDRPGDYVTPTEESLFVQNEEQKESNLWSNTVAITQDEYVKTSNERRREFIDSIVPLVKSNQVDLSDIPESLHNDIKSKL